MSAVRASSWAERGDSGQEWAGGVRPRGRNENIKDKGIEKEGGENNGREKGRKECGYNH